MCVSGRGELGSGILLDTIISCRLALLAVVLSSTECKFQKSFSNLVPEKETSLLRGNPKGIYSLTLRNSSLFTEPKTRFLCWLTYRPVCEFYILQSLPMPILRIPPYAGEGMHGRETSNPRNTIVLLPQLSQHRTVVYFLHISSHSRRQWDRKAYTSADDDILAECGTGIC